jgi:hypothetical protein
VISPLIHEHWPSAHAVTLPDLIVAIQMPRTTNRNARLVTHNEVANPMPFRASLSKGFIAAKNGKYTSVKIGTMTIATGFKKSTPKADLNRRSNPIKLDQRAIEIMFRPQPIFSLDAPHVVAAGAQAPLIASSPDVAGRVFLRDRRGSLATLVSDRLFDSAAARDDFAIRLPKVFSSASDMSVRK